METLRDIARKLDQWTRSLAEQLFPQPAPVPVRVKQTSRSRGGRR